MFQTYGLMLLDDRTVLHVMQSFSASDNAIVVSQSHADNLLSHTSHRMPACIVILHSIWKICNMCLRNLLMSSSYISGQVSVLEGSQSAYK